MHTNRQDEHADADTLREMGYERRDVAMKKLGRYAIGFFAFTFFCFAASWAYFEMLHPTMLRMKEPVAKRMPKAPNPILQSGVTTMTDIMALRQHETEHLTTTGWANDEKTRVRIPIDRAIELLASKGLPKTGQSVPAVSKGTTIEQNATGVAPTQ
ncbi:MAG: hypothetical protein ACOYON_04330 [Fimbriimonas sp.]